MTYLRNLLTARFIIALLVMALFGGAIIVMSFFVIPEQNIEVVIQLVGGVNTLAGLVIGFYFGSMAQGEGPQDVHVTNDRADPVPTEEET